MTLSQDGINYICLNFGDAINHCCVSTGLSWYYTYGGTDYPETGGTAQIVSRLASGLVDSLTMTSPATGTFTQAQLNTANGSPVTLQDAQQIAAHDEPSEGQYCLVSCSMFYNQVDCESEGCYWWNNSCHDTQPSCEVINNQIECSSYGCYWWSDNTCHSTAEPPLPECVDYITQADCLAARCYWWMKVVIVQHNHPQYQIGGGCQLLA